MECPRNLAHDTQSSRKPVEVIRHTIYKGYNHKQDHFFKFRSSNCTEFIETNRKLSKKERQRNMLPRKEQDKTSEKELNE